jgi:hypothetical protein
MLEQFYRKALPSQGVYCATGIKEGRAQNRFAETLEELLEIVDELKSQEQNVFVAMSTFKNFSRKADNALYSRALFIDLDVDPDNPKKYNSKEAALAALDDFITISKFAPPVRVDSGGGIHAYWLLDQDIPIDEWKRYADKFKKFCADHIKIDMAVTADAARVLRCPETLNYKTDLPRETKLLDSEFGQYSFHQIQDFLGVIPPSIEEILASIEPDLPAKPDNFEYVFNDIVVKSLTGQGCSQINNIVTNQATLEEPLWRAGLSVAVRCVDGKDAIHLMSQKHPGYTPAATEAKANETLNAEWAYGCSKFEELNPAGCNGCVFKGKFGKSGPIQLGRQLKEAPSTETISEEDAVRIAENPEEVPLFPVSISPYVRGANGGVWYKPKAEVDEEGNVEQSRPFQLIANDFFPIKRMYSPTDGEVMLLRYIMPKDPTKEFLFPMKYAYAYDKMKEILSSNSINFPPEMAKFVSEYLRKWNEFLQNIKSAEIIRMQMGWTENHEAFITGTLEIQRDGEERTAATSPLVKNVSKLFRPTGTLEKWQESANALNTPSLELHALGLLAGFGSPLMRMTSTPGAVICFMSPETGVGKTGSMYAGLSVFCDPYYISLADGSATDNALTGRYLALKNLLFGLDEVSNIDSEILSRLIHRISQGRAKARMQSSVNAEREIEMGASLISVMTTNQSLYDKLKQVKKSPDGEIARTIEFRLEMPQAFIDDPKLSKRIVDPFRFNYGHAGPMFIRHIYTKGETEVRLLIDKWVERFREDYGMSAAYRFYENVIACCFAGGQLAVEAGIINIDIERVYKVVIKTMVDIKKQVFTLNETDYKGLVADFFNKYHTGFLIFNDARVISEPRTAIVGRIEVHTGLQYVSKTEFQKYLAQPGLQISAVAAEKAWTKQGILKEVRRQRLTTGWKQGTHQSAVSCYVFNTDLPDDFYDKPKDDGA